MSQCLSIFLFHRLLKIRGGGSTTISTTISTTLSKFITVNATRIKVLSSGNGQGFDKTVFIYDN